MFFAMNKIIFLFILLFSIYTPSISQIDAIEKLSISKHYFSNDNDSLVISVNLKAEDKSPDLLRCKAILSSNSYKIKEDYVQDKYELEFDFTGRQDSTSYQYRLVVPVNILKQGRYQLDIIATDNNWQNIKYYSYKNEKIAPVTIGKMGLIQAFSDLSVSNDTSKFTFVDFDNNLDITSNKLEGVYTQGFCNDELVNFNGFKFHIWKDKSLANLQFSLYYTIDKNREEKISDFKISDTSLDGKLTFNNDILTYPFYSDENIEDITIDIEQRIADLLNQIVISEDKTHTISFRFVLKADNLALYFPKEGKLSYDFTVYDLPTGSDCQAALLPIDLLNWETILKKKIVYFEWTTVGEVNNNYFDVQRSSNITDWKTIATVKGNGTTNQANNYSAIDKFPLSGQNYYRLRQSDFDNNFKYSKVKSVYIFDNKIKLFPNPTTEYLYYTISDNTKEFLVEIFDKQGRLITDINLPSKYEKENRIDIRFLKKGTYFLKYYNLETHRVQVLTFVKI